jgi:hypothetical protein
MTRVNDVNPLDPWELSAAERLGRRQVREYTRFLRSRVRRRAADQRRHAHRGASARRPPADVDVPALRTALREGGAIL